MNGSKLTENTIDTKKIDYNYYYVLKPDRFLHG